MHTLFAETGRSASSTSASVGAGVVERASWEAWLVAVVALVLVFALNWSVLRVLGVCALLGIVLAVQRRS